MLGQKKYPDWFLAYEALEKAGSEAVPALIHAIGSDIHVLRMRAIDLIAKIGDDRAIEALTTASTIGQETFKRLTPAAKNNILLNDGTVLSVPIPNLWEEYRKAAREALRTIHPRGRR